jgi:hypothetical protein
MIVVATAGREPCRVSALEWAPGRDRERTAPGLPTQWAVSSRGSQRSSGQEDLPDVSSASCRGDFQLTSSIPRARRVRERKMAPHGHPRAPTAISASRNGSRDGSDSCTSRSHPRSLSEGPGTVMAREHEKNARERNSGGGVAGGHGGWPETLRPSTLRPRRANRKKGTSTKRRSRGSSRASKRRS